jgi:hypothetical protein
VKLLPDEPRRLRQTVLAAWIAWVIVLFSTFLPIWSKWWFGSWEASGESCTFWQIIGHLYSYRSTGGRGGFNQFYRDQFLTIIGIAVASFLVAWSLILLWPRLLGLAQTAQPN